MFGGRVLDKPKPQHVDSSPPSEICTYVLGAVTFSINILDPRVTLPEYTSYQRAKPKGEVEVVTGVGDSAWYSEDGAYLSFHTPADVVATVRVLGDVEDVRRALQALARVAVSRLPH